MNIKNILSFVGGVAIGASVTVLVTRKYFQDKYQKQYEKDRISLEKYYNRVDEYARRDHDESENALNPVEADERLGKNASDAERSEIKKTMRAYTDSKTNYAGMYREKNGHTEEMLAEGEHPLDQGEEGESDPDEEELEDVFNEHRKNMNKPPKIISDSAYSELPAHIDKEVLYFYSYDEMLCDENEEPIEDPDRLVGDALTKFDFVDSDELIIFVMNYSLDTCYEIQKVMAAWTDTH